MNRKTKKRIRCLVKNIKKALVVLLCLFLLVLPEFYVNDAIGLLDMLCISVTSGFLISKLPIY